MIGSRCRSCTELIAYLRNPATGNKVPVELISCRSDDTEETPFDPSRHKNHFVNCPGADKHRRRKK